MNRTMALSALACTALLAFQAKADVFSTYGDTTVVNAGPPTEYQLTAVSSGTGYAGLELQITGPLTTSTLTDLEADYEMTIGTFGGGAPRFTIFDSSLNSAWIYWGTPGGGGTFTDPNSGSTVLNSTGNLAGASSDLRVASNGFGGLNSSNTYETWSQFVSQVPNVQISYITLDLDGGSFGPEQQMLVDNFKVNGVVVGNVPEPGAFIPLLLAAGLVGLVAGRRKLAGNA
jgi:hypothetical protein